MFLRWKFDASRVGGAGCERHGAPVCLASRQARRAGDNLGMEKGRSETARIPASADPLRCLDYAFAVTLQVVYRARDRLGQHGSRRPARVGRNSSEGQPPHSSARPAPVIPTIRPEYHKDGKRFHEHQRDR
jgi:hypothetical protein